MLLKNMWRVGVLVSVAVALPACGLVGGGSTLSERCDVGVKNAAAGYVDLVNGQIDAGDTTVNQFARLAVVDAIRSVDESCSAEEADEALSLFVTTVAAAGDAQEGAERDALYSGVEELCAAELPRRETILSGDAQEVCGRSDAEAPSGGVEPASGFGGLDEYQIRYALEGSGRAAVRFVGVNGTEVTETVQLPWVWEGDVNLPLPSMTATMESGEGVCSITINGERRAEGGTNATTRVSTCVFDAALVVGNGGTVPPPTGPAQEAINEALAQNPALQQP